MSMEDLNAENAIIITREGVVHCWSATGTPVPEFVVDLGTIAAAACNPEIVVLVASIAMRLRVTGTDTEPAAEKDG
jgi:hypothetical protein